MESKQINVVWCDDAIENLYNESFRELFSTHNCVLYEKARCSDELKKILTEKKDYIDAVIVDFNVGESDFVPSKESASGFRWVHEHFKEYAPIPFYLYSARDRDFIKEKYNAFEFSMEGDYFFCENKNVSTQRNRYFQTDELEDLLCMIEEEVATINTPEFKVRQEYHEAFSAIDKLGLEADVFMKILLSDENIDRFYLIHMANPLRMVIERMISKMIKVGIIPMAYSEDFNALPKLLSGKRKDSIYYSPEDYMPQPLSNAFVHFLSYTQDGSHDKEYLTIEFRDYLKKTRDVYIIKELAIICLDVIKWGYSFYQKYIEIKPCEFIPFKGKVKELIKVNEKEGAIVYDDKGRKYFIPQQQNEYFKYKEGTNVSIKEVRGTLPQYGDYYCTRAWNLDVKLPNE